jgi:hypothetical protein
MRIQSIQFLPLYLDLDINIFGNIINVSHDILDFLNLNTSLFDYSCHVICLCHYSHVAIVLYPHLLLVGTI